ncbi:MAG: hypothetical protein R3C12_15720 [Planctomycetaceae bacterium]
MSRIIDPLDDINKFAAVYLKVPSGVLPLGKWFRLTDRSNSKFTRIHAVMARPVREGNTAILVTVTLGMPSEYSKTDFTLSPDNYHKELMGRPETKCPAWKANENHPNRDHATMKILLANPREASALG